MSPLARAAPLAFVAFVVAACNSTADDTTCDCAVTAIVVNVPVDIAPSISGVRLSGTACVAISAVCSNYSGGCSQWRFEPDAPGTCHVEIDSATGVFEADITIKQGTGCCTGLYASPESAATIDLPEPSGDGG